MKIFQWFCVLVLSTYCVYSYLLSSKLPNLRFNANRAANIPFNSLLAAKKKETHTEHVEHDTIINPRADALAGVLQQIERNYGKGSIIKLGDTNALDIAKTPSGSLTLDLALGGGYPRGRVVEIYGPESSGKTTLALHAIAEMQRNGGTAAFIDAEHALDPVYAESLGVKVNELFVCQPDSGEMALDIVDQLVRSAAVDIVVIDSVAALAPRAELEGDMADMQVGLQARLMSKALRKITGSLNKSQTTVLFLNQLRSKIGVMYGSPEVTSGGNALKFYSSVRLDIRRKELLATNDGILAKVKVVKNKVFPPFRVVEFEILFGTGINKMGCLVDAAEAMGLIERKGTWYSYGDMKLGQGRKQVVELLQKDAKLLKELEDLIKKTLSEKSSIKFEGPKSTNMIGVHDHDMNNNVDAD